MKYPAESTIIIANLNTSDIISPVSDTQKPVYTFDRIHVLDSGVYQSSALNGIKPLTDVTSQMTLDLKGIMHRLNNYNWAE